MTWTAGTVTVDVEVAVTVDVAGVMVLLGLTVWTALSTKFRQLHCTLALLQRLRYTSPRTRIRCFRTPSDRRDVLGGRECL